MDKMPDTAETLLLNDAINTARGLGVAVQVVQREPQLGRTKADALVRIDHGGQEVFYAVDVRDRKSVV